MFPNNPVNGQQATVNNILYTYNSSQTAWVRTSYTGINDLTVTGNVTANYYLGNGSLLTGIITSVSNISNGTSNINIPAANGNIQVSVGGTGNVITFTNNNAFRGSYGLTGAIFQANTAPASPQPGDQWYNTNNGILFEYLNDGTTSQWVDVNGIPGIIASSLSATAGTVTTNAQPNITSVGTLTSLVMAGNITPSSTNTYSLGNTTNRWDNLWLAGNTIYLGNADIKANATSLILTNPGGGQLVVSGTGVASSNTIYNGNSNVTIATANGNVTLAAVGNTTMTITGTGANVTGTFRSTGATVLASASGNVGIGNASPGQKLTVAGTVESTSGGFKFPDGTTQNTAAAGGGGGVTSFSAGSTGFSPGTATNGAVTLSGTLYATSGGTGVSSSPTSGQLLIGTSFGSYNLGTLTAGSGISITNSSGNITIAATGAGGPTINVLNVTTAAGNSFYNYSPNASYSKPLIGSTTSPSNYGAFCFDNASQGYLITSATLNSIGITDSTSTFTQYNSGTDFGGSPSLFSVYDSVVACYGLFIYNAGMQTLFADSAAAITSPSLASQGMGVSSGYSSANPYVFVSCEAVNYESGMSPTRGIVVSKSGASYYLSFGSANTTSFSPTVQSLQTTIDGTNSNTYYVGSDFTVGFAFNSVNGMFTMSMSPSNATLTTLLDNSFLGT